MNYYCAKFYTNISTNMDTTNIFHFLAIFSQNFYYFPPPPQKSNFGPFQLDFIAYIFSKAMNYNFAKFHAFIKKINDWCNFPLAITYFMCFKLTIPPFFVCRTLFPPPPPPVYQDPTYTDYALYIYTSLI